MFLHTFNPHPILAHLGPLTIRWYGLLLSLGALTGFFVFRRLGQRTGLKTTELENAFFLTAIAGIVGARLYHVLNEWGYYAAHPNDIWKIWNGGLAIHGAILAGLLTLWAYSRRKRVSLWLLLDLSAPAFVIGQAIGRWGNYFNQELFGRPTTLPWGLPIEQLNRPIEYLSAPYFHPTFLYESLGSLAVFVLLIFMLRARHRYDQSLSTHSYGAVALTYFILESMLRAGVEMLRIDRVPLIFGARLPLLVSLAIALVAAVTLLIRTRRTTA